MPLSSISFELGAFLFLFPPAAGIQQIPIHQRGLNILTHHIPSRPITSQKSNRTQDKPRISNVYDDLRHS